MKTKKQESDKFNKDVEKLVIKLGGDKTNGFGYKWSIETKVGELHINIHESDNGSDIFSIYCRFENVPKAVEMFGKENGRLNIYSGKFNFHELSAEKALNIFYMEIAKLTEAKILTT